MRLGLLLAAAMATSSLASPLAAQSLAREIEIAPDGWVVFQYALERDVEICSNGSMRRGGSWSGSWSDDRDDLCGRGVTQAQLRVQDGEVTEVEIRPPSGGRRVSSDADLGERDPQEVADYFMMLASESRKRDVAEDAIVPAIIAKGVTVWPQLKDIALDRGLDDDVRAGAVFWLSQVDSERALEALEQILSISDEPDIQERAIFAVSQHESSRSTEILMDVALNEDDRDLRKTALFWLGQSDDPRVAEFLLELIRPTAVR